MDLNIRGIKRDQDRQWISVHVQDGRGPSFIILFSTSYCSSIPSSGQWNRQVIIHLRALVYEIEFSMIGANIFP